MSPSRAPRASLVGLWSLAAVVSLGGCSEVDPALRARRAERDQLRREVVGFRGLEPVASSGLMLSDRARRGAHAGPDPPQSSRRD